MNTLMRRGSLFDDFFRDISPGFYVRPLHGEPLPDPDRIKIDVKEGDKAYTVLAEIPGVPKDDVHIAIDGNVVTLSAEIRQQDAQTRDDKLLRSERYYGSVSRAFSLPQEIDAGQAKARCDNGVLTLTLPKKSGGGAQRIRVD